MSKVTDNDPFKSGYRVGFERSYFGKDFLFKEEFYPRSEEVLIAEFITEADERNIKVFVISHPANFWRFVINDEYEINTGSGSWYKYKYVFKLLKADLLGVSRCVDE